MSKMDNLRAMREAKYAETLKRSAAAAKSTGSKASGGKAKQAPPVTATPRAAPAAADAPSDNADGGEPARCGHRNMSGRSCTREHGHAAKSHRYS